MSNYENAPATQMVATKCACCAKPLVDAVSVETGVGPDCRKKHGYGSAQKPADLVRAAAALASLGAASFAGVSVDVLIATLPCATDAEQARTIANKLVHCIAIEQDGRIVDALIAAVDALGFETLAARCAKRVGVVDVRVTGDWIAVKAPFSQAFNDSLRRLGPGMSKWDKETKTRYVFCSKRTALWNMLRDAFAGYMLASDKGLTPITARA